MNALKQIAILGSTGSIGQQTLDIIEEYSDRFEAYLITANSNIELLIAQAYKFKPKHVIIANEKYFLPLKEALSGLDIIVESGAEAIKNAVTAPEIDIVVTAMVGYSGLAPTISAIKAQKDIALANKETLVVAGELIAGLLNESKSTIYPVDSEHGAIYQCLIGEKHSAISKLILTASGGPFRTLDKEQLKYVTKADALKHPNWKMGAKITIDSASMMNKGFELIEAKWLFNVDPSQIEVVVHPQSIIHSMVEFSDGSVKAQLGLPDMHIPIRFALGCAERLESKRERMKVSDYANLTFERPDLGKFPLLRIASEAISTGGNSPCVLNAANEIAVDAFLNDRIGFMDIPRIIVETIQNIEFIKHPSYDEYVVTNKLARDYATSILNL